MDISLDTILYICGAIVTISGAAVIINKLLKKTIENTTKDSISKAMKDNQKILNCQIKELKCSLDNHISSNDNDNKVVRSALLSITRDRINQAHDYYMRKGFIGAHSLFAVEELYTSYKQLGGNSFVDRQMEDIRDLEVRSAEIDDQ